MTKTPVKPPTNRETSIAGKGLSRGNLTKGQQRTLSGRVNAERAVAKRGKGKS